MVMTDIRGTIVKVFHIEVLDNGVFMGTKYIVLSFEELNPVYEGSLQIRKGGTTSLGSHKKQEITMCFNPNSLVQWPQTLWLAGPYITLRCSMSHNRKNLQLI